MKRGMEDAAAVSDVLDERPELESDLEAVLAVDEEHDAWTFDDVPIDSGAFGELVSRGLVEKTAGGDGYHVPHSDAVRAAVVDEDNATTDRSDPVESLRPDGDEILGRLRTVDRLEVGTLVGALLAVVVARVHAFPSVFRDGAVVLSANDPYYYRYWVEQALAGSGGLVDLSALSSALDAVGTGEPLLVLVLWFFASLLGGSTTAAGWVLAWYPVVAAVTSALLVYLLALRVTDDRRVALAAVVLLAVTPAHAFRTSLGFADHHAFDYMWLALTAYALTGLETASDELRNWESIGFTLFLGMAAAGQVLSWDAGPLMLVPVGAYGAARTLYAVRSGRSPLRVSAPLLVGITLAAVTVLLAHVGLGWHNTPAAFAPALLLAGLVGVVGAGELVSRFDWSARVLAAVEAVGLVAGLVVLRTGFPSYWAQLSTGLERLAGTQNIAEAQSLLSGDALGWLLLFGFVLVLAVPYLVWASREVYNGSVEWLAPVVYAWYFLGLAVFQVRFAGQLSLFSAVFAGLGFVHLAAVVDISRPPVPLGGEFDDTLSLPDRRTAVSLVVLFALVGGLSVVQVPVKTSQVTTGDGEFRAASWTAEYAADRGWSYPDSYVFSTWSKNRMYNYLVNGQSSSYAFAQGNYDEFAAASDGERLYRQLRGDVNLVVVGDRRYPEGTVHARLHRAFGSESNLGPGLSHYRAVFASEGGSRKVFTLVPGTRMTGPGEPNTTYTVSTDVTIDGASFTYTRDVRTDATGIYSVTIPYPGEYTFGDARFDVSSPSVREGRVLSRFDGEGEMYWSFDESRGTTAYDTVGGYHGEILNGTRTDGVNGSALRFVNQQRTAVRSPPRRDDTEAFTVSAWIRPQTDQSGAILSTGKGGSSKQHIGILFDHGLSGWNHDQIGLYVGNGTASFNEHSPDLGLSYPTARYHHVAAVFDRGQIRWYLDGEHISTRSVQAERVVHDGRRSTYVGRESSGAGGLNHFDGDIDEVRYYETALSEEEISTLYHRNTNTTGS